MAGTATMRRGGVVVAGAALLLSTVPMAGAIASGADEAVEAGVVLNEVTTGGPGGISDAFVELRNLSAAPMSIAGWELYHCGDSGSRGADPYVTVDDVVLEPGEVYLLAHAESNYADQAAQTYDRAPNQPAFGQWLQDGEENLIDRLSISPASRDSICGAPLPSALDAKRNDSYQRVGTSGDVASDWIRATATPGEANATEPIAPWTASELAITEIANGGPSGTGDEFLEIGNLGTQSAALGGWRVTFCDVDGSTATHDEVVIPTGTDLAPGEAFVLAPQDSARAARADLTYTGERLPAGGSGALLTDADLTRIDGVGVYETDSVYEPANDSPCTRGDALPNRLDFGSDHSYQRVANDGAGAADFIRSTARPGDLEPGPELGEDPRDDTSGVRVTELVHDGPEQGQQGFLELANTSDEAVSIDGWQIQRCEPDGRLSLQEWVPVLSGELAPGETYLAALEGSDLAPGAQATFTTALTEGGYGVLVRDAEGAVVDTVGVLRNRYSPCVDGVSLAEIISHEQQLSYQRYADTGDNARDFVHHPRTPHEWAQDLRSATDIAPEELAPVEVAAHPRPLVTQEMTEQPSDEGVELSAQAAHTRGEDVDVAFYGAPVVDVLQSAAMVHHGVSEEAPPSSRTSAGEVAERLGDRHLGGGGEPLETRSQEGYPYQRFTLTLPERGQDAAAVMWRGSSVGANELQMYAWNHRERQWDLLGAEYGREGAEFTMIADLDVEQHLRGVRAEVLIQDGPAQTPPMEWAADDTFADPADYDFAIGYLPDTQHLTEGYRQVYADQISWLVANSDARNISYVSHVGDAAQSWMWGSHPEPLAREEFEAVSELRAHLTTAQIPNGILPGNHDNKWGRDNDLFNEYFGPASRAEEPWFGGSIGADDASGSYDLFEAGGADFLALNFGYPSTLNADEMFTWAAGVIAEHPNHNVLIFAHEFVDRDGEPTNPENERWTSLGYRIQQELIDPFPQVRYAISGHINGTGDSVVEYADGRQVSRMLSNYQNYEVDGEQRTGFLRLLQVHIDSGTVAVNTYTPTYDLHNAWRWASSDVWEPEDDEFLAPLQVSGSERRVATTQIGVIGPDVDVATISARDGEHVNASWQPAADDAPYVWWTVSSAAGDGGTEEAISAPRWLG